MEMIDVLVYLPLYYNDGTKVEDEKLKRPLRNWRKDSAVAQSMKALKVSGYSGGKKYADEIKIIEITAPETPEVKGWFNTYARDTLKHRFKQEKIWLKFRKSEVD